jgi:hypothetical protein
MFIQFYIHVIYIVPFKGWGYVFFNLSTSLLSIFEIRVK